MSKSKLYVIGNGFDLHHGLKTSYADFREYVRYKYNDIFIRLSHYIFNDDDKLWRDFENSLSQLNINKVMDVAISSFSNSFTLTNTYDYYNLYLNFITKEKEILSVEMFRVFREFIIEASNQPYYYDDVVCLDKNSYFLNFNFTNSLERIYKIKREDINYIHNSAIEGNRLILGHGINPKDFEDGIPEIKQNNYSEQLEAERFKRSMENEFEYKHGKEILRYFYSETFKPTEKIIDNNKSFFKSLSDIDEVFVLGHSLSEIDLPYFREIKKNIKLKAKWTVSYYNNSELDRFPKILNSLGVTDKEINLIRSCDLVTSI